MYDIITIGGGPAALSAAITARARNKTVAVISADYRMSGLYKAPEILNYPGLPAISGSELLERMIDHARAMGAELLEGRTVSVIPGETFLSRFLLHVLPKGFVRIRYYGILACRCKG